MIIDTNIYSGLKNNDQPTVRVLGATNRIALPLPVVAELKYGFIKGARTTLNESMLSDFLAQRYTQVLFPSTSTCDLYAELNLYTKQKGRALSNNDIWIAALSREDGDTLLTFDRDFEVFKDIFGDKLKILS
jgi:tRNA(fMet)-specific endonuclease VapC